MLNNMPNHYDLLAYDDNTQWSDHQQISPFHEITIKYIAIHVVGMES